MPTTRVTTHPGEVLREEFMAPLGLSAHALAGAIGVPANRISELARERRGVTADTAIRLGAHFSTTPEFWLNLQTAYDLSTARAAMEKAGSSVPRLPRAGVGGRMPSARTRSSSRARG